MIFKNSLLRPRTYTASITFIPPAGMDRVREGALSLADPMTAGLVLRAAMVETLLVAYQQRYLAGLPGAVNMRRDRLGKNVADPKVPRKLRNSLIAAYTQLRLASETGNRKAITTAQQQLKTIRQSVHSLLKMKRRAKKPFPSSGTFRQLALALLEASTGSAHISLHATGDTVVAGIGLISYLDSIKTPSATQYLNAQSSVFDDDEDSAQGGAAGTQSDRDILWRHLEFGTGAFAVDKSVQHPTYRLPSGGWWYGKSPDRSLHLLGSKPIAALRDPATRLPYAPESLKFRKVFAQMMAAALFGT
jgi:hypothetical protein